MIRKLVQHGPTTLITSLPATWIKKYHLSKGNEVFIKEIGKDLLISAREHHSINKEINCEITSGEETYIRMIILNAYRSGCDVLHIQFQSQNQYKIIHAVITQYLLGFEITKKEKNSCTVENVATPNDNKLDVLLRRMFYLLKESLEMLFNDLNEGTTVHYQEFMQITFKLGQYDNFCKRHFSLNLIGVYAQESHFIWNLSNYLLQAQHSLKHLYEALPKVQTKMKFDSAIKLLENIVPLIDYLLESFFKQDLKKIAVLHEKYSKLQYKQGYTAILESKKQELIIMYHLNECLRNIYSATSPVIGYIMARNIKSLT